MSPRRKLPQREQVFVLSLIYHGYRLVKDASNLRARDRYVILSNAREDADGIDFWIKPARCTQIIPVQITQRGTALHRKHSRNGTPYSRDEEMRSRKRLRNKRLYSERSGIRFVLVRDYDGCRPSKSIAWGDKKALRHALNRAHL